MLRVSRSELKMENITTKVEKIRKLVGRVGELDGNAKFYFCDSLFEYIDNFKGATGSVLRPVSKDEYDERTDPDNINIVSGGKSHML